MLPTLERRKMKNALIGVIYKDGTIHREYFDYTQKNVWNFMKKNEQGVILNLRNEVFGEISFGFLLHCPDQQLQELNYKR